MLLPTPVFPAMTNQDLPWEGKSGLVQGQIFEIVDCGGPLSASRLNALSKCIFKFKRIKLTVDSELQIILRDSHDNLYDDLQSDHSQASQQSRLRSVVDIPWPRRCRAKKWSSTKKWFAVHGSWWSCIVQFTGYSVQLQELQSIFANWKKRLFKLVNWIWI